ncbi:hypothetical protein RHSIM_Rhsim13G0031100 [Rhododendron simsii]|uniref:DNA-directed RNA polymerase subunit n=1 Tax=Rhododendron simsii TaxID=118357 RepID=A0A834G0A5_RHOSS|nr:hypothetical protein RHSIM_Rhsim13G0031100 [Rhododendron simsii]
MFCLSLIEHTLRLPPHLLDLPLHVAIRGELEALFLDKVIANLGLCVSVYDIQEIGKGFIFPGDGASTYTVLFRLIMFCPFVGEVIAAKLKESDANGLRLSLGFFEDIYVPVHLMPNPSHLKADPVNSWVWEYEGQSFPIDGTDEIRFQVQSIKYPSIPVEEEKPASPSSVEQGKQPNPSSVEKAKPPNRLPVEQEKQSNMKEKQTKPFAPMVITGSLDASGEGDPTGLGPISWW